jgi:hypothetical protein
MIGVQTTGQVIEILVEILKTISFPAVPERQDSIMVQSKKILDQFGPYT